MVLQTGQQERKTRLNTVTNHDENAYLETGHRYLTTSPGVLPSDSLIKSIGMRSLDRKGRPEKGLGGRFGGSTRVASLA